MGFGCQCASKLIIPPTVPDDFGCHNVSPPKKLQNPHGAPRCLKQTEGAVWMYHLLNPRRVHEANATRYAPHPRLGDFVCGEAVAGPKMRKEVWNWEF